MPYANEHAARLTSPDKYDTFARKNDAGGAGVDFVFGIKEGKSELQAIRFDASKFTPAEAKTWLKDHDKSPIIFEPAKETKDHSGPSASEITLPTALKEDDDEEDEEFSLGLHDDGTMAVEAFAAGKHTDAAGNTQEWSDKDIKDIVDKGNAQLTSKPIPVVIGHPDDTAPAYGWVEKFKQVGGKVVAKLNQLNDNFVNALKAGTYKGRSISLYEDNRVRHIGFLGGAQPAVEGLKPFSFEEKKNCKIYDFQEEIPMADYTAKDVNFLYRLLKKFGYDISKEKNMSDDKKTFAELDGKEVTIKEAEAGGQVEKPMTVNDAELKDKEVKDPGPEAVAKIETAKAKNAENEEQTENAELKNQLAALIARIDVLESALAKNHSEKAEAEIKTKELEKQVEVAKEQSLKDYVEALIGDGRLRPADREMTLMALEAQIELDKAPVYNMSETKDPNKKSRLDTYKEKLNSMPKIIQFGEFPNLPPAQAPASFPTAPTAESMGQYIEQKLMSKMAEQDKLGLPMRTSYSDMLKTCHAEANKEFPAEYTEFFNKSILPRR